LYFEMDSLRSDDPRSDSELVEAFNRGEEQAFAVLYNRYRNWVAALARRFTGNDEDALDVLQEVFTYLLGRFPGFHLTSRMTTFLYPTVKHFSEALKRKKRRFLSAADLGVKGMKPGAETPVPEELADLLGAVRSLPETHREILLMRFVDDMSLEEIAAALRTPLGTVKSRLHRAVGSLRGNPLIRRYFEK